MGSMEKFKANAFFSFTFGVTGQICLGFGWGTDRDIKIKVTTQYNLIECYKKILTNLVNWGEAYFNTDSKILDDCSESTSASTIVLYDYTIANVTTSAPIVGADALNGPACWAFANY